MSEFSSDKYPKASRELLLAAADRLFASYQTGYVKIKPSQPLWFEGMLPDGTANAVSAERKRAESADRDRQKVYRQNWRERSLGKKALDLMHGISFYGNWPITNPEYRISGDFSLQRRRLNGHLQLAGNWRYGPPVFAGVAEQYLEGVLDVDGKDFELDPNAKMVKVDLGYPLSDGSRIDLGVSHTLYPYLEDVITTTQVVFGDYWSGVPHEPFTDSPADPSVYMQRALEMLVNDDQ